MAKYYTRTTQNRDYSINQKSKICFLISNFEDLTKNSIDHECPTNRKCVLPSCIIGRDGS